MTPETIGVGIGLILGGIGWLVIAVVRSAWAERRAARVELIARVNHISAGADANSLDVLLAELLAPRVPQQRGAVD